MKEIYKDLVGFEGYYEVSNLGNVKRKKNKTIYKDGRIAYFSETVLKKATTKRGYEMVYLSVKSKKHSKLVHRLIANTFIPNPLNKKTVNHIDCDKKNNRVDNLEWLTNKENIKHAFDNGLFKERDKRNSERARIKRENKNV
jgi:hypothetical protein